MSDKSAIEWTDATWSPVTGCTKVSPGCANCYIERTPAFRMTGQRFERGRIPVRLHPDRLDEPLHWRKPRRVFVVSMGDLFHEDVPDEFIEKEFAVMALADRHTFQVLTKRPKRMQRYLAAGQFRDVLVVDTALEMRPGAELNASVPVWPLSNVWLGVSVENQRMADERIPLLLETPAAVRFLSCEPLLGPLDLGRINLGIKRTEGHGDQRIEWDSLTGWEHQYSPDAKPDALPRASISGPTRRIDWVIVGGESGPGRAERKLVERCHNHLAGKHLHAGCYGQDSEVCTGWHPKLRGAWVIDLRDQCQAAGVPFFFKQWGGPRPTSGGRLLDGREWNEMPQREAVPA